MLKQNAPRAVAPKGTISNVPTHVTAISLKVPCNLRNLFPLVFSCGNFV